MKKKGKYNCPGPSCTNHRNVVGSDIAQPIFNSNHLLSNQPLISRKTIAFRQSQLLTCREGYYMERVREFEER